LAIKCRPEVGERTNRVKVFSFKRLPKLDEKKRSLKVG